MRILSGAAPGAANDGPGPAGPHRPADLPGFALRPVAAIATGLAALLITLSGRYGYHRDELYFLACGQHLAWGYPDQPPLVPLLARVMTALAPGSLVVLRLPSALASAALVLLTGLTARELGAERRAQALAAAAIAIAPMTLGAGHLLSTTTFDLPAWALVVWLVARILRTGDDRLWLAVGLATGIGLFDSDLLAFGLFGVIAGLLIAGPRRPFRSPWLYAGGVIAVALWLPYLAWQASHGWPELAIAHSIANGGSGTSAPPWEFLPFQLVLTGYLAPVWIAGLVRLLRARPLRWCRALGVAWLVLAAVFIATGGKPYYLGGLYPLMLGAGAQPTLDWLRRGRSCARAGLASALVVLTLAAVPIMLPVVPVTAVHQTPIVKLNYDAGETIGWPAYVREIAAVYRSLPAARRSSAIVLASNYGEAGAVLRFGPADGLPAVYSGHNAFWYWGPPPASARLAVAVGYARSALTPLCGSLRLAVRLNNHLGVADQEQGAPVWICSDLRTSWSAAWPRLRFLG
ncbi:MAG: glycosyltransferase family 39 protein [Streptosporangiaceae bacterium]